MRSALNGIEIYESPFLTETKNVARSPSRALRRWKRGIRATSPFDEVPSKNVVMIGGKMYAHPAVINALVENLKDEARNYMPPPKPILPSLVTGHFYNNPLSAGITINLGSF